MKKILITGANGFIGKNICQYFKSKYQLFTPSHQKLDLIKLNNVTDYIVKNRINIIIHAANIGGARTDFDKKDIIQTNLRMFFNLVHNLSRLDKIIYFGSGAEFNKKQHLINVSEKYFNNSIPEDDYGFYKYICSKYLIDSNTNKIINLRLFGIYGQYENYLIRFISNSIVRNLLKLPIKINQNVVFDFLYVDDLLPIVNYFIGNKGKYNIYNVTSGSVCDLKTIVNIINNISDNKSKITIKNPGLNFQYSGTNKRLSTEIKKLKFTPIEQGIAKLFQIYKKSLNQINKKAVIDDKFSKYCIIRK